MVLPDNKAISGSVGVLLFCECMREGEDMEGAAPDVAARTPDWFAGEYDVLSTEAVYVEVARHRGACRLQPDLVEPAR